MKKGDRKKTLTIRLFEETHGKLIDEAKKETRSIAQQVEHIIKLHFRNNKDSRKG